MRREKFNTKHKYEREKLDACNRHASQFVFRALCVIQAVDLMIITFTCLLLFCACLLVPPLMFTLTSRVFVVHVWVPQMDGHAAKQPSPPVLQLCE